MKILLLFFMLISSNLMSQTERDSLITITNVMEIFDDYTQRDRESSKKLIQSQQNHKEIENTTLITDTVKQYNFAVLARMSTKNILSIVIIREDKEILRYTDNKRIIALSCSLDILIKIKTFPVLLLSLAFCALP